MACTRTLQGLANSCKSELGGILEAYFTDFDNISAVTVASGAVQTISLKDGAKLYTYQFDENVSNFNSTRSVNNGIGVYNHTINLQFKTLEAAKNVEVSALAEGHLAGIVKTRAKNSAGAYRYFFFGYDGYLTSNDSTTADSGTNFDDFNGYNLVLNGQSAYFPFEIAEAMVIGLAPQDAPATA